MAPLQFVFPLLDFPTSNWYALWSPFDMLSDPAGESVSPLPNKVKDQV